MSASCLHLLPSSELCGARTWLLEELSRTANNPSGAIYAASLAGHNKSTGNLGVGCLGSQRSEAASCASGSPSSFVPSPPLSVCQWLELSQRPHDPQRWWRLWRWLQREQPAVIRFWFAPGPWLRRLCRIASPRSRWQVLFRSPSELPKQADLTWSSLDTAWFDSPLLLANSGSALAQAGKQLLPWPRVTEKVPETLTSHDEVRKALRARLGMPAETILLVTVGPLLREKNQDQLLWSLDQLSCTRDDVRLLVIGDGPDRARLEHHARLHHVTHLLTWLGQVASPREYLRVADLYVSADPRERVSRALLEARAVGLPIIAHDTSTNRQIVTAPEHGKLVDPTYLADYAGTMYRWLQEKAEIKS